MQTVGGGASALMYACQQCKENQVLELIRKKVHSVRERDRTSKTPLHYCAENANMSCAEALLRVAPELVDAQDDNGYCPLHLAVIAGNKALVKLLIAKGADVTKEDNEGHSAVHWAIVSSEKEALEMIVRAGANPSTPDIRGGYPLHYAVQMCGSICGCDYSRNFEDAIRVVECLLNFGVDVNVKDKDSRQPILWAASAGSADAVIHLVSAGACVEAADKDGLTALHCAASRGHTATLETLISLCGAHVDVIDGNGCSALFYSVTLGHADATELLLRLGADPNRQDRKGRTPAHCGAAKGQLETLRILQKHGGDLWLRNVKGDIPLHEAVASGRKDLVLWLLSQNPEAINLANNDGRCPLHIASMYNNTEMVKVLLDSKSLVNPVMRTSKGVLMTPLNVALCRGHRSCGKYLQLHGGVPFSKVARLEPTSDITARVSPSDEITNSAEAKIEISSHSKISKGKGLADVRGSQESEKSETGEKKKFYRRRRKKKYESNVPMQDTESDESVQDVKVKKPGSRRGKKTGGKDENENEAKTKKVQLDAKSFTAETTSSKSISEAISNKDEVAEDMVTAMEATKTKTLHSTKSFGETKNVSDLTPEDFPPQMQPIDQLDVVIREPEIEEHKPEGDDGCSRPQNAVVPETAIVESNEKVESVYQAVPTEGSQTNEVNEDIAEQIVFSQKQAVYVQKAEKIEKTTESKKSSKGISSVKSPTIPSSSRKLEKLLKSSDGNGSSKLQKADSTKILTVTTADQTKKSLDLNVSENGGSEKERKLNSKPIIDDKEGIECENEEIDKRDKNLVEVVELEEVKSGKFITEESGSRKNEFAPTEENENLVNSVNDSIILFEDEDKEDQEKEIEEIERTKVKEKDEEEKTGCEAEMKKTQEVDKIKKEIEDKELEIQKSTGKTKKEKTKEEEKKERKIEKQVKKNKETGEEEEEENKEKEDRLGGNKEQLEKEKADVLHTEDEKRETEVKSTSTGEPFSESLTVSEDSTTKNKSRKHRPTENTEQEEEKKSYFFRGSTEHVQNGTETVGKPTEQPESSSATLHTEIEPVQFASEKYSKNDKEFPIEEVIKESNEENNKNINSEELTDLQTSNEAVETEVKVEAEDESRGNENCGREKREIVRSEEIKKGEGDVDEEKGGAETEDSCSSALQKKDDTGAEAEAKEQKTPKGSRVNRLCRRQKDLRANISDVSITQLVQNTLRKYHIERGIFYQLLELKRYQIRSGRANEQVLVKRLADEYGRERVFLGMKPYSGLYRFREFEKFLYDQLKALNARRSFLVPEIKSYDDIDALSTFLKKSRHKTISKVSAPQMTCTCITQRCHHSACAYTSVPCSAYITDLGRLKRHKPTREESFFPRIQQTPYLNSNADEVAGRPATLELIQGGEKHVITLPQNYPDKGKRYYVTFTIKGAPACREEDFGEDPRDLFKHRHAKSV